MTNAQGFWLWDSVGKPELIAEAADGELCALNDCIATRKDASSPGRALSWISGRDVGAMAAELLINDAHASDRILIAGGVERLSYSEVAKTVSAAVGKPVRYDELTPDEWRCELTAAAKAKVK